MTSSAPQAAPTTADEMIARLPFRIKGGGWTVADVEAMKTGVASLEQFCDKATRMRLCTFAGYFERPFIVRGSAETEYLPAFHVVPHTHNPAAYFGAIRNVPDEVAAAFIRVSAHYVVHETTGKPFDPAAEDLATGAALPMREPINARRGWIITTEGGPVLVRAATVDDTPKATRDGVMAFLESPSMAEHLKR